MSRQVSCFEASNLPLIAISGTVFEGLSVATDNKFERVDPYDKERCQHNTKMGQCPYRAVPGCTTCHMHGGIKEQILIANKEKRLYRVSKWQSRISEFADSDQVKTLREEVGILRVVLEETLNKCNDSTELLIYSSRITDTVLKIEKLVASCHRLEASTGNLLDKTQALQLASVIVEIIARYIDDPVIIDSISEEVMESVASNRPEEAA